MTTSSPRWTPRWWHWLLLVVVFVLLLIFTVLLTLRTAGRADYQRVLTDLRAQSKAATIDEFIAQAPIVDISLQEAWHRWSSSAPDYPDLGGRTFKPDEWIRYVAGEAPASPVIVQEIEDRRAQMQIARDLLRDPRLLVSTYGSLAQDLPPGKRRLHHTAAVRMPNLLTTRSLANWLHHAACTETDPRPALDDFDRFHRALSRPATLIDAMIWVAISAIRNDAYLHLALLGRLPEANRAAWLAEECRLVAGVADGLDSERMLFTDSWAQMGEDTSFFGSFWALQIGTGFSTTPTDEWKEWLSFRWLYSGPWAWATIHHDSAVTAELVAHISARLRGERADPVPDWTVTQPRYWGYGAIGVSNLMESAIVALEADAKHRMFRLAVTIISDVPTDGLPPDQIALDQRLGDGAWLTPTGDHLHLSYERLGDHRFRLVVSPSSPIPNFDIPSRLTGRTKPFGAPADKRSLVTHPQVEVELPARLRTLP